jgi:hypothetical protein
LNALTEHRCPECGRGFDPANPETFQSPNSPLRRSSLWRIGIGVLLAISFAWVALAVIALLFAWMSTPY